MVVLSRVPYPLAKGDKLRAFNQIKYLSKHHDVYLFCLTHKRIDASAIKFLSGYCKEIQVVRLFFLESLFNIFLAFLKGLPLQIGYFFSQRAKKRFSKFEQKINPDRLYCQFIRTTEYTKNSSTFKILDYQDTLSKNIERRSSKAPFYLYPILRLEYKRLRKYERVVFDLFDEKIIISEADRIYIEHLKRNEIHVVPNGVDTTYFHPMPEIEKNFDFVFTGNMSYAPNVNAAQFLVKKIMPFIWENRPEAKILIAGANPNHSLLALRSKRVVVSGWVKDMRNSYAQAKIFIAPMQIGTGLQNKLLEAMAMQIPCITSELANKALHAKNKEEIIIAKSAEEYAKMASLLLNDKNFSNNLARKGYEYVCRTFSWDKYNAVLESIIVGKKMKG